MVMKMRRTHIDITVQWLSLLLFAITITIRTIHAQSTTGAGGTPWMLPFGIVSQDGDQISSVSLNGRQEHFASALVYDSEFDRIYVTGVSHTRKRASTSTSNTPTIAPMDDDVGSEQSQDDDAYYYNNNDDDDDNGDPASVSGSARLTKSDCFLGILQVPRRGYGDSTDAAAASVVTNSNDWIRQHTYIGTRESQEACSGIDIVRRGNDHKVYLIGHSLFGESMLENQLNWYNSTHQIHEHDNNHSVSNSSSSSFTNITNSTTAGANQTTISTVAPVVYGFVMDVTWYNGHVPTGYLMHHVPVEYPIGITASSISSNEDIYVASIQSLSGIVNPAHTIYETMKRQMDGTNSIANATTMLYDTTTSGSYAPPEYGESYSFHLRRIGERSQSLMDVMTLPNEIDGISNATLYDSKIEGSKLLNLLRLSKQMKTSASTDTANTTGTTTTTSSNAKNATTKISGANSTTTSNPGTDVTQTQPLSFGEYRFVVEPLVERWGRTFSANVQEETSTTTTTLRPSLYSIQVSSLLRCTITTLVESGILTSNSGDDDSTNDDNDDNSDDDAITYVQRQQDMIIVAGSTRGSGLVLGGEIGDTSLHGFVSSFDATTGVLLRRRPIVTTSTVTTTTSSTNTVSRNPGYTVRVFGMCQQDPYSQQTELSIYQSAHYIYIVGMTDGIIDHQSYATQQHQSSSLRVGVYQAFIQKIDAATLSVQWTKQLGAAKFLNGTNTTQYGSIHGISCAVTPDGYQVYLGGTVLGGATITMDGGLTITTKSFGRDDIFVAQFMTSDGKLNYVKQIGTPQDDTLANGVSLVADKYGNAIALGNTRGSLLGVESSTNLTNKVILISIDRMSGNHVDISGETEAPEQMVEQTISQQPTPSPQVDLEEKSSISTWSDLSRINIVYICVLGILVTALIVSVLLSVHTCRQRGRTDKMIAQYLLSLTAENSSTKYGRRQDDNDNSPRTNDIEHTKLFTNEDYDHEYATESSYDDDYETVSFVPTSQQSEGPTTLTSEPMSNYKDSLLRLNDPQHNEKSKERATSNRSSFKNQIRIKLDEIKPVDNDPLRRWLVRDP